MRRVYVAGPYSADNVISALDNIRNGIRASTEIFLAGFAPFCPWLDYHYTLMLKDGEVLAIEDYYEYSISWLSVSDAMYVLSGYEKSNGTLLEIDYAKMANIPVFFDIQHLIEWNKDNETS